MGGREWLPYWKVTNHDGHTFSVRAGELNEAMVKAEKALGHKRFTISLVM